MKLLSGISVLALLVAGAATPSFATNLTPGTIVTPGTFTNLNYSVLGDTGVVNFNFGGDVGSVEELVGTYGGNPFGANDISFAYQINVTGGNIVNLTTESFAIPGISIDVGQIDAFIPGFPTQTFMAAATASLTGDGTTLGFGFTPPDGLGAGDTSWVLIINTNLTNYTDGVFSLQDGQTKNFDGFVPTATPEPSSLALLGTGLLGAAGMARRKLFRK